jgi:hypothetical protein
MIVDDGLCDARLLRQPGKRQGVGALFPDDAPRNLHQLLAPSLPREALPETRRFFHFDA